MGFIFGSMITSNHLYANDKAALVDNHVLEVQSYPDAVIVPHNTSINPTESMSIEFWVKPNQPQGSWARVIGKRGGSWGEYSYELHYLQGAACLSSIADIFLAQNQSCGPWLDIDYSGDVVCNLEWNHIAITINGTAGEATTYVNGVLIGIDQFDPSCTLASGSSEFRIGNTNGYTETQFIGKVDNVRIWNVALTQEQVLFWMNNNITVEMASKMPELGASWDFENGAQDATGVNNGYLNGSASIIVDNLIGITDCNNNGIDDLVDIANQTSFDCDQNSVPDECQPDCDGDGWIDACDNDPDVDGDGIPDNCEPDCNANSLPDDFEIEQGIAQDCNGNGIPDECDLMNDPLVDCDGNDQIDNCEIAADSSLDCNENGLLDVCEINDGLSSDCNSNLIPDECDIANGTSTD